MTFEKPREIAARVLQRRAATQGFVEDQLEEALGQARLAPPDRRLVQELVYGCVRWEVTLDWLIARKTHGRTQKPTLQTLLRLGLYQLFWLDRVPEHAAVHETVELGKHLGCGPQAGFLNAVLRGYAREREVTRRALDDLRQHSPHLGWSHPEWLLQRWQARWDAGRTRRLLEWNNTPPDTFARVNTLAIDPGRLLEMWRHEGVEYDFFHRDWTGENTIFRLKSHPPLSQLESFRRGGFYIQDPSTVLAARELDPQAGDTVLDLCAAPGGKATLMAQFMGNQGRVVAADLSSERLELIRQNVARLGAAIVEPVLLDASGRFQPCAPVEATTLHASRFTNFDHVLIDAPCSNTGVLRRRVELRWRIRPGEIERLRVQQGELLRRGAGLARPGGTLVYSTCSLEPEENEDVVAQFLREHSAFKLERERHLTPFADGVDGAYVARLSRTG